MSVCLATERVLADYETIGFLLEELVKDFPDERDIDGNCEGQNMKMLREDMRRIVWCHQSLNRNFKNCAENSAFPILMTTCVMCVDTCMNIYILLEADDLETIINYAVICVFINVTIFFSYNTGQRISNQSDIFRQSLADVPWIGKPKWFKQALIVMMLRTNIDNQMKPYGIYVLNYLSFKDVSLIKNHTVSMCFTIHIYN
ncbi:uncharacterized protein LOC120354862 isoform X1 [Nilaparvata lugens]|uniref:uncharacterized protein LOC120354862 isoform X1 n=1 Tax=Nilaparvata lugens TaxID=108931 RepID=UPI00193CD5CA|nr:uncharacterized protein LOC120354862 isoform X1 [Nilaparvata lugens]